MNMGNTDTITVALFCNRGAFTLVEGKRRKAELFQFHPEFSIKGGDRSAFSVLAECCKYCIAVIRHLLGPECKKRIQANLMNNLNTGQCYKILNKIPYLSFADTIHRIHYINKLS